MSESVVCVVSGLNSLYPMWKGMKLEIDHHYTAKRTELSARVLEALFDGSSFTFGSLSSIRPVLLLPMLLLVTSLHYHPTFGLLISSS